MRSEDRTLSGASTARALGLAALVSLAMIGWARAEDRIGATAIAVNEVARVDKPGPIAQGDAVFRNETVRTGAASSAKFVFVDDTNLALGATSTVVLDRFVFDDASSYSKAAVNLAKGAFRFTSGHSPKDAYEIRTGNATIGVRGTILDIKVTSGRTVVTLVDGAAVVCPRQRFDGDPRLLSGPQRSEKRCIELTHAGDTAVVTSKAASRGAVPFSFASAGGCGTGGDLCGKTGYGGLALPKNGRSDGGFPDGALCGR